ncbi:MAG TPA: SseB family protein [Micromonospora sp.]
MTEWEPATEVEAAMRDALRVNDQERYFRILAGADLLLPISVEAAEGRAPVGWGTWTTGGRTHVLAFTSESTLRTCLGDSVGGSRRVSYRELAQNWPNHDWWLAVNPGLPIEGYLPAWFVAQLARGDARLPAWSASGARVASTVTSARATAAVPARATVAARYPVVTRPGPSALPPGTGSHASAVAVAPVSPAATGVASTGTSPATPARVQGEAALDFVPANEVEQGLWAAVREGSTNSFLSTLLLAQVLVPVAATSRPGARPGEEGFEWRTEQLDGERYLVVYTSPARLLDHLGESVETVEMKFVQLIRQWPDASWSFAVNPGSPIGAKLPGAQVIALANWADEVGLRDDEDSAQAEADAAASADAAGATARVEEPTPPTMMQKVIPPGHLAYYLERGYDRVCGFVHRVSEVAHLTTPAKLVAALGLDYAGSPFSPDAEEVYVVRWPAYRPSLYRIPYGGPNEQAMRAMDGWVIERPPFRGNGFAPSSSGDVIAEFKVDSVRLPHGAQLVRIRSDGTEQLVATLDCDGPVWRQVGEE